MPVANKLAKKFLELHGTLIFLPAQLLFRPTGVLTGCAVCVQTHHHISTDKKYQYKILGILCLIFGVVRVFVSRV
jgi:hypothetical protein